MKNNERRPWEHLKGKKVTVMGIGLNSGGVGTIEFLSKQGAHVIATDLRSKEELREALKELKGLSNITYVLGQHRVEDFKNVDLIIKNPAVPRNSHHIRTAREHGIPVESDLGIFMELCLGPILGVTGTKGKSTTTTLLYNMVKRKHKDAVLAGNIGVSPLTKIDDIKESTPVILELSSWQLEDLAEHERSPHIGILTNLFPDHLNRYPSLEAYYEAKKTIFQFQSRTDFMILNNDSPAVRALAEEVKSTCVWFSKSATDLVPACVVEEGTIQFRSAKHDTTTIASVADIALRGEHNLENALAAAAAATVFGIDAKDIRHALTTTKTMEHRLELVDTHEGIEYINDTTATTPEALKAAIQTIEKPIIAIVGGTDKECAFTDVAPILAERTKDIIFLAGSATEKLVRELKEVQKKQDLQKEIDYTMHDSLASAFEEARRRAQPGDAILFSPGATSFQMFKNEFDRGRQFKELVERR